MSISTITRLNRYLNTGDYDYDQAIRAATALCHAVANYDGEGEDIWYIGELGTSVSDMIPAIYWHCSEYHTGQWSSVYAAMCAARSIFEPNMATGPEPDSVEELFYNELNDLALSN